jgi:hypothetical protein
MRAPALSVGLFSALIGFSTRMKAAPESDPPILIEFGYHAPSTCLDEDEAFSLVQRRSRRVVRGREGPAELSVTMNVVREGGAYRGVLTVVRPGAGAERRTMEGANCSEVVEALALTAALSVDPEATVMLDPAEGASNASAGDPLHLKKETPVQGEPKGASEEGEPGRLRANIAPFFAVSQLMTTGVHLGGGLGVSLSQPSARSILPLEAAGSVVVLLDSANSLEPNVRTTFVLSHFAYCPLRFGAEHALLLCPSTQLGVLVAESRGFDAATSASRFFATVGLEARLRSRPSDDVELWLTPALDVPLTQRSFAVEPGPEVLVTTVDLGFHVWAGLGWSP